MKKLYTLSYYSDQWMVLNYSGKCIKMGKNKVSFINYFAEKQKITVLLKNRKTNWLEENGHILYSVRNHLTLIGIILVSHNKIGKQES